MCGITRSKWAVMHQGLGPVVMHHSFMRTSGALLRRGPVMLMNNSCDALPAWLGQPWPVMHWCNDWWHHLFWWTSIDAWCMKHYQPGHARNASSVITGSDAWCITCLATIGAHNAERAVMHYAALGLWCITRSDEWAVMHYPALWACNASLVLMNGLLGNRGFPSSNGKLLKIEVFRWNLKMWVHDALLILVDELWCNDVLPAF